MTVKERHYWKFIKQILFLLNYILFIIKICQMCKIKSHWMFSVVFFMFYICVICDCVCVLKYAIYLIWPRQFSFGPDSSHLAHVFLIWLIPWPEQKMSQRGPCKSIKDQIWPCHKTGQCQSKVIIWISFDGLKAQMLCMGVAAILVKWPKCPEQTFVPPTQGGSTWNLASICPAVLEEIFENVGRTTDGQRSMPIL